ncbi:MAG: phosphatidylglycerol lysyltransferase, partial [Treponema sp.]|nr:phosphatidylglycerol lysyltransferase [Treponema sp.]
MITELNNALKGMILSASGWRGVFAEDGNEESSTPEISFWHSLIAAAAAKVFSGYLKDKSLNNGAIIVGMDTRPTGKAIASAVIKALLGQGREAWFTGIAAAPEIMAFARLNNASVSGFIYISASHNPIGHNGIKFGLTDGGVLQGSETAKLVTSFNSIVANETEINVLTGYLNNTDPKKLNAVYNDEEKHKKSAINAYRDFTAEVISGFDEIEKISLFFDSIRRGLKERPLGIAADLNGSARALSIDRDFLKSLGASYYCINDVPGKIAHRIVPEGESLEPCRAFLEELHRKDPSVILGYMPDCDGDRGNLVIWDDKRQCSRSLEAQEVFALACMAELSSLAYTGQLKNSKAAIAVNDPTSLRIDKICRAFGVKVFRAEVGEANVVGLARKLRGEGYLVRILGEGSAGGTITHPSAVRDPIDTLGAILKLL